MRFIQWSDQPPCCHLLVRSPSGVESDQVRLQPVARHLLSSHCHKLPRICIWLQKVTLIHPYGISFQDIPNTFKDDFFILPLNRAVCVRIVHFQDPSANHAAGMNLQNWAIKILGFWSFFGIQIPRHPKHHGARGMPPTWPKHFGHLGAWQRVSAGYCR